MIPSTRSRKIAAFESGAIAMLVALLLTVILRPLINQPTLAETVGDRVVVLIPGNLFETGIQTLGPLAKRLLFVALSVAQVFVGGVLAIATDTREITGQRSPMRDATSFVRSAFAALIIFAALVDAIQGAAAAGAAATTLLTIAGTYGLVVAAARSVVDRPLVHQGQGSARKVWYPSSATISRRGVLYTTAAVAVGATGLAITRTSSGGQSSAIDDLALASSSEGTEATTPAESATPAVEPSTTPTRSTVGQNTPVAQPTTRPVAAPTRAIPTQPTVAVQTPVSKPVVTVNIPTGEIPETTPNNQFYKVSKNFISDPRVDGRTWRLSIEGLVGRSTSVTMSDLSGLKSIEKPHTLTCISNEVGGNLISNAVWKGVRLADLLHEVGVRDGVRKVVFHAADGYADSIPLESALDPDTLLAYQMNGVPIPSGHGYPLRVLVPNIYGMKNVKWLTKIELVNTDFQGYWQRGGWSDSAIIKTMSRIDVARGSAPGQRVTISGIAFAGARGIERVELSADGGRTWQPAQVKTPRTPNVWTLWVTQWTSTVRGTTRLLVRAVDGTGQVQTARSVPPFPDGASGYHSIEVHVG